jgi:hypothetical protein
MDDETIDQYQDRLFLPIKSNYLNNSTDYRLRSIMEDEKRRCQHRFKDNPLTQKGDHLSRNY